jgi:CDP-diacylglycerol---serine O-phosphatidyltransferase
MRDRFPTRRHRFPPLRRGVYLLPSLFTTANIFCGFTAIMMSFQGEFQMAAILILIAGVLDGLDGRIARMTGGTSDFGGEFDSLADVVSFGMAPSFLAFAWGLAPLRRYGWVAAFLFLICGAVRLARFNIQHGASDRRWFVGLPIPMAAAAVAGCVLCFRFRITERATSAFFALPLLALAGLMVSRIRYRSFKDIDLRLRLPFRTVLLIAGFIAAIALNPHIAIFALALFYVLSGPVAQLLTLMRRGTPRRPGRGEDVHGPAAPRGGGVEGSDPPAEVPFGAR